MALMDVLASIPGRGAYLAQQQFDQQQNLGAIAQLIRLADLSREQELHPLRMDALSAQAAEYNRRATEEAQGAERLRSLREQFEQLQQPSVQADAADNLTQLPGLTSDQALRRLVPRMVFDPSASVRNAGTALTGRLESIDARQEALKAAREQRMVELQMRLQDQSLARQERAEAQQELERMRIEGRRDLLGVAASLRAPREDKILEVVDPKNPSRAIGMPQSEYLRRREAGEDLALRGGGLNPNQIAQIEDRASRYLENNPTVKLFTALEPEVRVVQNYMPRRASESNANRAVYDKNLVNTFLRMTHPKGDQISNFERRDLAGLPDVYDRFKTSIASVFQGRHLPDDIANAMNMVIQEKYGAMHNTVSAIENQAVSTVTRQGGSADAVRRITRQTGPKKISTDQEYDALKSGEEYIAPDGSTRTKK